MHLFEPVAGGGTVDAVGASAYQGPLLAAAGGVDANGPRNRDTVALLMPEPTNPLDPNAVRTILPVRGKDGQNMERVGYLSALDAVAYRPLIDRVAATGQVVGCRASLSGGETRADGRRDDIGLRLHLAQADILMAELDAAAAKG